MKLKVLKTLLLAALCASIPFAAADDTELYTANSSEDSNAAPLVMISLDYRANLGNTYNGCNSIGGPTLESYCEPIRYFKLNCPTCTVPTTNVTFATQTLPVAAPLTFFSALRLALQLVLSEVALDRDNDGIVDDPLKLGLMISHQHNNNCAGYRTNPNCSNGGYIARGFELIGQSGTPLAALNEFHGILRAIPEPAGNLSHSYQGAELFFEFYRYLKGLNIYNAHNGVNDYTQVSSGRNLDEPARNPDARAYAWDTQIETNSNRTYRAGLDPTLVEACAKVFSINFVFGVANQEADSDRAITGTGNESNDEGPSGAMTGITLSSDRYESVISYLYQRDLSSALAGKQNVTSYFIYRSTGNAQDQLKVEQLAVAGGTDKPLGLSDDPGQLVDTLRNVFRQILSVSTTFVSASVPVNAFNRASIVNNIYVALFQPPSPLTQAWPGNIKKLILQPQGSGNATTLIAVDAQSPPQAAFAPDGRLQFNALTYWTRFDAGSDAANTLMGTGDVNSDGESESTSNPENVFNDRDGRNVARGGAGQQIPGFVANTNAAPGETSPSDATLTSLTSARKLYYDSNATTLAPLNVSTADDDLAIQATLHQAATGLGLPGVTSANDAQPYLKYARGLVGDNTSNVRRWIMGDTLHSRPLPINYGARGSYTRENPAIYIAIGSNDGYMRFIRNTETSGAQSGVEAWGFMPLRVMGNLVYQKENRQPFAHRYGVDGEPTVRLIDRNNDNTISGNTCSSTTDCAYLYFGLRRGGRALYALNVTNPEAPAMAWRKTESDTGYGLLGLTFSQPKLGNVAVDLGAGTVVKTALFFAGGYSPNKDFKAVGTPDCDGTGGVTDAGCAIFVVDADNGTILWQAKFGASIGSVSATEFTHTQMVDSIPSEVSIVDANGDGNIDRMVVGDTGGKVWRVDLYSADRTQWSAHVLADINLNTDRPGDRRFEHAPDIVFAKDSSGARYDAVVIGSGDREDPLDKVFTAGGRVTVQNFLYVIKDTPGVLPPDIAAAIPVKAHGDFPAINCATGTGSAPDTNGWKCSLGQPGEKSLSQPITLGGTIFFTTFVPKFEGDASTCGPREGGGRLYALSLALGGATQNFDTTNDSGGETKEAFKELRSGGIPAEVVYVPGTIVADGTETRTGKEFVCDPGAVCSAISLTTRYRTFWQNVEK